jgi:hypothetical protein
MPVIKKSVLLNKQRIVFCNKLVEITDAGIGSTMFMKLNILPHNPDAPVVDWAAITNVVELGEAIVNTWATPGDYISLIPLLDEVLTPVPMSRWKQTVYDAAEALSRCFSSR